MVTGTFDFNHLDHDYSVRYSYTPGDPGKLTGPWEDSYPPEDPEPEIETVFDSSGKTVAVTGYMEELILDAICEEGERRIMESIEDCEIGRMEAKYGI